MALARVESHQYVLCRRCLFPAFREAERYASPIKSAPTGNRRGRDHHYGGARRRPFVQPQLRGMGLPPLTAKFSWADLPALFFAVGSHQPAGYGSIPAGQLFS